MAHIWNSADLRKPLGIAKPRIHQLSLVQELILGCPQFAPGLPPVWLTLHFRHWFLSDSESIFLKQFFRLPPVCRQCATNFHHRKELSGMYTILWTAHLCLSFSHPSGVCWQGCWQGQRHEIWKGSRRGKHNNNSNLWDSWETFFFLHLIWNTLKCPRTISPVWSWSISKATNVHLAGCK